MKAAMSFQGGPVLEGHWLHAAGVAAGGFIGAFGLWLANRMLGKAAFQTAINAGFSALLDQLQEERVALQAELQRERLTHSIEATTLRGEIRMLRVVVGTLIAEMRGHGLNVPTMPVTLEALHDIIEVPATKEKP